jgi:hypothetical protein
MRSALWGLPCCYMYVCAVWNAAASSRISGCCRPCLKLQRQFMLVYPLSDGYCGHFVCFHHVYLVRGDGRSWCYSDVAVVRKRTIHTPVSVCSVSYLLHVIMRWLSEIGVQLPIPYSHCVLHSMCDNPFVLLDGRSRPLMLLHTSNACSLNAYFSRFKMADVICINSLPDKWNSTALFILWSARFIF